MCHEYIGTVYIYIYHGYSIGKSFFFSIGIILFIRTTRTDIYKV